MNIGDICPQHKTYEPHVGVPTIVVEPPEQEEYQPRLAVQWFGEADVDISKFQFRFPVSLSFNNPGWMGHPEKFKVVLLGQVKDWPKPEARDAVAKTVQGTLDTWILWVTSSHYTQQYESGEGPACFMIPFKVLLADPDCGVITPRKYCDLTVLQREKEKVR